MKIEDLYEGMQVRIIELDDGYNRPEHWAAEMDEWQCEIVTISGCDLSSSDVYIREDEGKWSWHPWDFEPYCSLAKHDPNIVYKRAKERAKYEKFKITHGLVAKQIGLKP